jgi:hypothetical protein
VVNIPDLDRKAKSGSVFAQSVLGACYLNGVGVEVDYKKAFQLLSAAAERQVPRALVNLARMHAEGLGIPKSLSQALRLYEEAAERGEFLAQVELGRIYSRGIGVAVDSEVARNWYTAAVGQEAKVVDCEELREAKAYLAKPA